MSDTIDTTGLDRADVLSALYNRALEPARGWGFFDADSHGMDKAEAEAVIGRRRSGDLYFDYLKGRVMQIDVGEDLLDPRLYDRDNGSGAAAEALAPLLERRAS